MIERIMMRIQRKAESFRIMMDRLGINPALAARVRGGTALAAASRRCLGCIKGEQCKTWLDKTTQNFNGAPPFCPNAEFFAEVGTRQASWPGPL